MLFRPAKERWLGCVIPYSCQWALRITQPSVHLFLTSLYYSASIARRNQPIPPPSPYGNTSPKTPSVINHDMTQNVQGLSMARDGQESAAVTNQQESVSDVLQRGRLSVRRKESGGVTNDDNIYERLSSTGQDRISRVSSVIQNCDFLIPA